MDLKQAFKEELTVSGDKLKAIGIELGTEALEEVVAEISDLIGRVALKTDAKWDDFYMIIKPMLDKEIEKIHEEKA